MKFSRYAIYVTVPPGPLNDFGAAWLGWNAATGERPDAPIVEGLPKPAHTITARPRKYGLHGTMKPPFRLADGHDFEALNAAFADFCARRAPVPLGGLALTRLGRFLALTPTGDPAGLAALAFAAVKELDGFRAPATEAELDRRRQSGLTPRQEALLLQWGYPYVGEEFRFHITLSGPLSEADAETTASALAPHLTPLLPKPYVVQALTLCGEDSEGMFHELHRCALTG